MDIIMENLTEQLKKDMKKIVGDFNSEAMMVEILKKRLTKKEFKFSIIISILLIFLYLHNL